MFPDWCYIVPTVIAAIIAGAVAISAWELVWFIIHHWAWIWPNLKHAVHWFCFGY